MRAWLSHGLAFARSAEPRVPLSRRAILTDIAIAVVALVASLLAVRSTYAGQPAQYTVDPRTRSVVVLGVTQVQEVWEHAWPAILSTSVPLAARRRTGSCAALRLTLARWLARDVWHPGPVRRGAGA